jgi:hypothetical protein
MDALGQLSLKKKDEITVACERGIFFKHVQQLQLIGRMGVFTRS